MFTEVITDRVRAREERRLLANQLVQAQKIEAIGTLAGGIAHDFNNLLAMIGTNAELGQAATQEGDRARTSFDEIVKAAARAKEVVRQILVFSRRQESARQTISLRPVVEDAVAFLRATLPTSVEFRTAVAPEVPPVSADTAQVYQILMNLGTNAGHAMPAGGVLAISLDHTEVSAPAATACGVLQQGEYVRLSVQDTGTGMSRDMLDRIFEPFFTTKGLEGTGLGLSVVHGLVKDHGGAITVESAPGKGSTFAVYLPVARTAPADLPAKDSSPVHGHGERVMYIDDEPSLGSAMDRVLTLLGYHCTFQSDPRAALEAIRADPYQFDAVISDMTMPFLSGFDVAKELRAIRPDLPVALTSGRSSDSMHTVAASLGIKTWIYKPATIDELSHALELLLQSARPPSLDR
jgi:nitrogen-specific signal transduction histidine kinase/CheY-like chemotaxis protein